MLEYMQYMYMKMDIIAAICFLNSFKPGLPFVGHSKQHSPRCDAAERGVPSGAMLFAQRNFIKKLNRI